MPTNDSDEMQNLPESRETEAEAFDRIGSAAVEMFNEKGEMTVENTDTDDSPLKWLLPLIILILLVIIGAWFCSKSPAPETKTEPSKPVNANAATNANK